MLASAQWLGDLALEISQHYYAVYNPCWMYYGHHDQQPPTYVPGQSNYQDPVAQAQAEPAPGVQNFTNRPAGHVITTPHIL